MYFSLMDEKEDEAVIDITGEYWTDTKAITRIDTKLHRVRWTIENVSHLHLDTKIIGPDVHLMKDNICKLSVKKDRNYLYINICNNSDLAIKIQRNIVLFNSEGVQLHQDKMGTVYPVKENDEIGVMAFYYHNHLDSLKDDLLIIDIILKVEEHVTTQLNFFSNERELRENLIKDFKAMFNDPVDSDFTLRIGNEFIRSHKFILRARSTYFRRMFEIEMKESTENFVSITDVSLSTMKKLVEFLYTGDFTKTEDDCMQDVLDLYVAADKYQVMDLRSFCANELISTATVDSIIKILQLSIHHNDQDTKNEAMNFICFHFDKIVKSNNWKTFLMSEAELASEVFDVYFKKFI